MALAGHLDRGGVSAGTSAPALHGPRRRSGEADAPVHLPSQHAPTAENGSPRRASAFVEVGLGGDDALVDAKLRRCSRPKRHVRFRSQVDIVESRSRSDPWDGDEHRPSAAACHEQMPVYFPTLPRLLLVVLMVVLLVPNRQSTPVLKVEANPLADPQRAGSGRNLRPRIIRARSEHVKREDSPTDACKRWAGQTAVVNGTLYLYGGRVSTSADQTTDTWSNDFLALDLTTSWQISSPSLTGLPKPDGPPAVSLGYLWNSYDTLYLYGGEFSDSPATLPVPFSTWAYDIASSSWSELSDPVTSAGENSSPADTPVQRAAEGAGLSVPNLGRGFYFGGHLDGYTTPGWSQSIARVYIRGLLEYTFPGYANAAVEGGSRVGAAGVYRNITQGGLQDSAGFPERADGVLVYVPGFGQSGIILGLAGGTNATFTQMNVIDVYDIARSTWYKQATSGPTPKIRVNPCAVAVSAADGSSTQVYMYGGQNLIPYGEQVQYDDLWILSIPSFTWIAVDTSDQATPPARAGHACNVWNGQMVVVGGYTGPDLSCDSPGVYVFNTSSLSWQNQYTALTTDDALNRQKAQQGDSAALQGSYGYAVPAEVQSAIGGNEVGAATVTAPAQSATQGPLATGRPPTYNVTQPHGSAATETSAPASGGAGEGGGRASHGTNVGAIVAGVIAGVLAVVAAYLGFCVWLYRRQLSIYRNHAAMAHRQHLSEDPRYIGAAVEGEGPYSDKSASLASRSSAEQRSGARATVPSTPTRGTPLASNNPYRTVPGGLGTASSSTEDLMAGQEPSFLGVFLNPRRSLRVVNRD